MWFFHHISYVEMINTTEAGKNTIQQWPHKLQVHMQRVLNRRAFVLSARLTCSSDEGQVWRRARPTLSLTCRLHSASLQHFTSTLRCYCQQGSCLSLSVMSIIILPISCFHYCTHTRSQETSFIPCIHSGTQIQT